MGSRPQRICDTCAEATDDYEIVPFVQDTGIIEDYVSCRQCSFEGFPSCDSCAGKYPIEWLHVCGVCNQLICHECLEDSQIAEDGCLDNGLNPSDPAHRTAGHEGFVDDRVASIQRSGIDWWPHEAEVINRVEEDMRIRLGGKT